MQRKNHILNISHLKNYHKAKRKGFAMMMAISVLVVVATIMALSLSMTSQTTKRTTDLYLYEQAILLSKSATEYALLQISQSAPCSVTTLNFPAPAPLDYYDIEIDMRYIYTSNSPCVAAGGTDYTTIATEEQNGSVLMDVTVSIDDENITSEPIRFFRRSLQKL